MTIYDLQAALKRNGYDPGPQDGSISAATLSALFAYAIAAKPRTDDYATASALGKTLSDYMGRYGVVTRLRIAHFVAQIAHESAGFTKWTENLNYRTPSILAKTFSAVHGLDDAAALIKAGPEAIANRVYAGRGGNGNEASGDGWRYRGRGAIQTTFHDNYKAASDALSLNLLANPDQLAEPDVGLRAALVYWQAHDINTPADANDIDEVTRRINKALDGVQRRTYYRDRILSVWKA